MATPEKGQSRKEKKKTFLLLLLPGKREFFLPKQLMTITEAIHKIKIKIEIIFQMKQIEFNC